MSQFPSTTPAQQPDEDDDQQITRQLRTDALIQSTRAATPQSAIDKRATPRLTIAQLNALDMDQIKERFASIHRDDRTPVQRVFDTIDLSRNSVANIAAGHPTASGVIGGAILPTLAGAALGFLGGGPPGALVGAGAGAGIFGTAAAGAGLVRAATSPEFRDEVVGPNGGELAAAGQPTVMTSDILRAMGVKNRIARGVVGFAGDVAFDPLTYIGAPGWGATLKSGEKAVHITGPANRAIDRAIAGAAAGAPVDSAWGRAIAKHADLVPQAGESATQAAERIRRAVRGEDRGGIVARGFRLLGAPKESDGGRLLEDFFTAIPTDAAHAERIAAAREAFQSGLPNTGRQLRLGMAADDVGAEVAHVPFSGLFGNPMSIAVPTAPKWAHGAAVRRTAALAKIRDLDPATAMHRSNLDAVPFVNATRMADIEAMQARAMDLGAENDQIAKHLERMGATPEVATTDFPPVSLPPRVASPEELAAFDESARRLETIDPTKKLSREEVDAILDGTGYKATNQGWPTAEDMRGYLANMRDRAINPPPLPSITDARNHTVVMDTATELERLHAESVAAMVQPNDTVLRDPQDVLAQVESVRVTRDAARLARARAANYEGMRETFERMHAISPNVGVGLFAEEGENALAHADKLERLTALRDMATKQANLLNDYAERLRIPITEAAAGNEANLVLWAKHAMHTDDAAMGVTAFGSVADALRDHGLGSDSMVVKSLDWLDKQQRRTLGVRSGSLNRYISHTTAMAADAGVHGRIQQERLYKSVLKAASDVGLEADPRNIDDLTSYIRARQYALADPEGDRYFWTAFDKSVNPLDPPARTAAGKLAKPSLLKQAIERLSDKGLLANPELRAKLDQIALDLNAGYADAARQSMDAGLLRNPIKGYTGPNTLSEDFAQKVRAQSSKFDHDNPTTGPFSGRNSGQTRFWDAKNNRAWRFFEFDRELVKDYPPSMKPADVEAAIRAKYHTSIADDVIEARQAVMRFDELAAKDKGFSTVFPMRQTDIPELNDLAARGRFHNLTGGALPEGDAFLMDPGVGVQQYVATHQRMTAKRVQTRILSDNSFFADPKAMKELAGQPGRELPLKGGGKAIIDGTTKARDGTDTITATINGQRFRTLSKEVRDRHAEQLLALDGRDIAGALVHEDLAEKIEDAARTLSTENTPALLAGLDKLTSWWKATTLFHPSWVIKDMVGGVANALSGGANPKHLFDHEAFKRSLQTLRALRNPELTKDIRFAIAGQQYTAERFARLAMEKQIIGNNAAAESMAQFMKANPKLSQLPSRFYQKVFGPNFRLNQQANDLMRLQTFQSFLEQGHTIDSAAEMTIRAMFDFADFTHTEREYFRRIIPFYSWMRSNLGYQFHLLMQRPMYAAMAPKLREALEQATVGDAAVPEELRPSWMRDNLAAQIVKNDQNGEGGFSLMLGQGILPSSEIANALLPFVGPEGVQKFLHYIVSGMNPVLSTPIQIGAGKEFFSGRTIAPAPFGDLTPGQFIKGQIRPVNEVGKIGAALERSPIEAATRSLLAGSVQASDQARLSSSRERSLHEEEVALRSAIRRADREHDEDARSEAEIRLLKLYQQMDHAGFEIPVWARKQLKLVG